MKEKICLVEDDATIRELVTRKLESQGFQIDSFEAAEPVMAKPLGWDLYIVDIMLRGEATGLDLCGRIRGESPVVPVLILSALSEPSDRIEGLKSGADDYLTKPFEMEELLLRVNGMLKRRSWYGKLPDDRVEFQWEGNSIHFQRFEGKKGMEVFPLTSKECMLMKLLIEKEGQVVTRDEILNNVWGYDAFPSSRTVDNFIVRLRKAFEPTPARPKYIHSVRGAGYRFTSKGEESP